MRIKITFILFFLTAFIFFSNYSCNAQGMLNDGATIIITAGANVYIDGDALGKYTNQTIAGSDGKIDLNGSMYVEGDWINNATGNNVFINNTVAPWGTVYLNGAAASDITGTRLTEFENLYVQNANRTLQITNCEVNNNLTVDNAGLILNQKKFIIDNNAAAGIASIGTGHVRSESTSSPFGEIQWNIGGSNVGSYIIPFGTVAPIMIPFTFSPVSGTTGNLVVATYPTNPANIPYPPGVTHVHNLTGIDNSALTVDRFWEVVVPGALTSANVNFRCTAAEAIGIPNPRAQRWIPLTNAWELPYQGAQSTAVTGTNVNGMSNHNTWWTLADITSPLPVELLYFKAECNGKQTLLKWSTASETNCKSFTIERSNDGNNFMSIKEIEGAGNSASPLVYFATDNNSSRGISYYRLKQTDYNGMVSLISKIVSFISCAGGDIFSVDLVDNPSSPSLLINSPYTDNLQLTIFDAAGKLINSENISVEKGISTINLKTDYLSTSVYLLRIDTKEQSLNKRLLIVK